MTDSSSECDEEELSQRLLECCERAYQKGLDSAEIYKVLHSQEILQPFEKDLMQNKSGNKSRKSARNSISSDTQTGESKYFVTGFPSTGKTFCVIFALTFVTLLGHFVVCRLTSSNPLKWFPTLQEKRCLLPSHPLIMEMVRPIANCTICLPVQQADSLGSKTSNEYVIELMETPSKEAFLEIAYSSKPIIIRQAGIRGGMPEFFNFVRLKEIFESEADGVDTVSEECQFLPFRSPFRTLREAFDLISDTSRWNDAWYIGWSNCHPGVAAKLRKLFPRPNFLPEDSESSAIDWIFIGSPGLGAAMHIDYVRRPSWQAQLSGVKTWFLRPPPECEEVCPDSVTFTINPGDILFLETNTWYHQTFIEGDTLSISIGSEYD